MRIRYSTLTLLFYVLFLPLLIAGKDVHGGWKLEAQKNGIKIYTRVIQGSRLKQVKGVTQVPASVDAVLHVLTDYPNYHTWINNVTESYVIKQQSDSIHYVYTFEDAPWPVQNRYNVSKISIIKKRMSYQITFEAVPDFIEERADAIQIEHYQGTWKISSLPGGGCNIEYIIDENPGGYIPPWLVNYMAVDSPLKTLDNLRSIILQASRS